MWPYLDNDVWASDVIDLFPGMIFKIWFKKYKKEEKKHWIFTNDLFTKSNSSLRIWAKMSMNRFITCKHEILRFLVYQTKNLFFSQDY